MLGSSGECSVECSSGEENKSQTLATNRHIFYMNQYYTVKTVL